MLKHKLWLCLPPFLFALLDAGLTLHGQPAPYWQGDYSSPRELNPAGAWLLRQHPFAFATAVLCWAVCFSAVILRLPARPAYWFAVLVTLGHTAGVTSWLVRLGPSGMLIALLFLLIAERFARLCWRTSPEKIAGTN
jgi:hypothetical protein